MSKVGPFLAWAMIVQCFFASGGYFWEHDIRRGSYYFLAALISMTVAL